MLLVLYSSGIIERLGTDFKVREPIVPMALQYETGGFSRISGK